MIPVKMDARTKAEFDADLAEFAAENGRPVYGILFTPERPYLVVGADLDESRAGVPR